MTAKERAAKVKMIIFDVDGVLTDGGIYVGKEGELFKPFYTRDGLGIRVAHHYGLKTAIITGRASEIVKRRAAELDITEVFQGQRDKRIPYRALKEEYHLTDEEMACVGDDIVDLSILLQAGFSAAPSDAASEVRERVHFVSQFPGGRGAVREVVEEILKAQGHWEEVLKEAALTADDAQPNLGWL